MKDISNIREQAAQCHRKGDYDQAIQSYMKVLHILEESMGGTTGHSMDTARCYRDIGSVLDAAGNFEEATKYFSTSLTILQKMEDSSNNNDDDDEAITRLQQGEVCKIWGNMLYKQEDYKAAKQKFTEALALLKDTRGVDQSKVGEVEYLIEVADMMAE